MNDTNHEVRYEADDRPPLGLTVGLAAHYTVLALAAVVLTPAILTSTAGASEAEMPLRLLRHYATAVRHQQYHDTDIVTFRVEPRG